MPKAVVEALNLHEGASIRLKVTGRTLVLESLQDPIQLALDGKKFASITPDEVEAISVEEQRRNDPQDSA